MSNQQSIYQNFANIIRTLKKIEKSTEIFSELKRISSELEFLERFVINSLEKLDSNFNSFVKGIDLLSDLVDFQKKVVYGSDKEKLIDDLFAFIKTNIEYDEIFIAFKLPHDEKNYTILTPNNNRLKVYQDFIQSQNQKLLDTFNGRRQLSYLVSDTKSADYSKLGWQDLNARSLVVFSLKVHGQFLGWGFIIRRNRVIEVNEISFLNLVVGLISLLIYQHFYSSWLKSRLIEQSRLIKVLDEVKYSEYFERGPFYLFSLDLKYVILHTNLSGEELFQRNEKNLVGTNFLELTPYNYRNSLKKVFDRAKSGRITTYRSPFVGSNGKVMTMEFLVSRVQLKENLQLLLVVAVDITENYYQDVIQRRNEILDEMDQFSRILVNQFNNLLTTVLPNLSILRNRIPSNDQNQQQLELMEKSALRSANLVQKFLNYDLEESENPESGNLNKLVTSFVNTSKREIEKKIDLKLNLDNNIGSTKLYPLRLRKLLNILIGNSILALQDKENGEITVSTRIINHGFDGLLEGKPFFLKAGSYIELGVLDNGCGIPEKSIKEVFKPFYSTRVKNEGVGLELFIAYNIVKDMKGQIYINSEVDKYTIVYVYLPFREEKEMRTATLEEQKIVKKPQAKQPTILVVDDEYNIRNMMKEIMEMSGLKVFTAGNGKDGVDVYVKYRNDIDLIIMDIVMPVMDGRAAFDEMIKIDPKQKIFIISGYSQREDLEDMLQKGAVGFLRKPFQVKEIVEKVQDILNIQN
jgi:PAS domain S-box-containing protein